MAVTTGYPLKDFSLTYFGFQRSDSSKGSDELNTDPPKTMWDYMRSSLTYSLTWENIFDVSSSAPISIQNEQGKSLTSSITPGLTYDSRDHFFNPTEG